MIKFTLETITPEQASKYLKANIDNRSVREDQVKKITRDMLSGVFEVNHQPIAFDKNGRLIDGQHRLLACAAAGVSFRTYVARYERYAATDIMVMQIDTNRPRNAKDILHVEKIDIELTRALMRARNVYGDTRVLSMSEIDVMYKRNYEVIQKVQAACGKRQYKVRTSAPVKAAIVLTVLKYPEIEEETLRLYADFVHMDDLQNMPPQLVAFLKYIQTNASGRMRWEDQIVRAMQAFDPSRRHNKLSRIECMKSAISDIEDIATELLA